MPRLPLLVFLLLATPASGADLLDPDVVLGGQLAADLTPHLFEVLEDALPTVIPAQIPVPPISTDTACGNTIWPCADTRMTITVSNTSANLRITNVDIVPSPGRLHLDITADVRVNEPSNPMNINLDGDPFCICIRDNCSVYSEWMTLHIAMDVDVLVARDSDGPGYPSEGNVTPYFSFHVSPPIHNVDQALTDDALNIDCSTGTDILLWFADLFGISITGMIKPELLNVINDLPATIEQALDELFNGPDGRGPEPGDLTFEDDVEVEGSRLHYAVYAAGLDVDTSGARLILDAGFRAPETAECVAGWDPGGSLFTESSIPHMLRAMPDGTNDPYDLGLVLSDDPLNQALYALWRGGITCYTIDSSIGVPLGTDFISQALGEQVQLEFERVFSEGPTELEIRTRPRRPPVIEFGHPGADLRVVAQELGLEFYGEVLGRKALLFTASVDVEADLGIGFTQFGEIALNLGLDTASLAPIVVYNEIFPGLDEAIEANLGDFLRNIIDTVAGGLLGNIYLGPFSIFELGIIDGTTLTRGEGLDFLEIFTVIGPPEPGQSEGGTSCEDCGGCADSGCDPNSCAELEACTDPAACIDTSSCSIHGADDGPRRFPVGWMLLLLPLVALGITRRR